MKCQARLQESLSEGNARKETQARSGNMEKKNVTQTYHVRMVSTPHNPTILFILGDDVLICVFVFTT